MDNIKDVVKNVIGKLANNSAKSYQDIDQVLNNILKKEERAHSKFIGEKKGVISFHVDSPAWLYQMKIRSKKMLKEIKQHIPEIKYIDIKIGKVK